MALNAMGAQNDSIEKMDLKLVAIRPGVKYGACRFLVTKGGDVIVGFCRDHTSLWNEYCAKTSINRDDKSRLLGAGYIKISTSGVNEVSDWYSHTLKLNTPAKYHKKNCWVHTEEYKGY